MVYINRSCLIEIDVSMLEKLGDGDEVEDTERPVYYEDQAIARYRVAVLILSVVAALSVLGLILSVVL